MATVSVFVCPGANQAVTDGVPSCTSGAGSWQSVTLQEPWDPSTLSGPDLAEAFGAGWFVMGTILAIIWGGKALVRAISGRSSV